MKKLIALLSTITVLCLTLISCFDDEDEMNPQNKALEEKLLGLWGNVEYSADSIRTYQRLKSAPNDNYYINFLRDSKLIEQKNVGWCGTPPIAYGEYDGKWLLKDSVIIIETPYWGGVDYSENRIMKVDDKALTIKLIKRKLTEK